MMYWRCPVCEKRLIEKPTEWYCPTCDKMIFSGVPTYMILARCSDLSGSIYIYFPKELGNEIIGGMTALDFLNFKENTRSGAVEEFLFT